MIMKTMRIDASHATRVEDTCLVNNGLKLRSNYKISSFIDGSMLKLWLSKLIKKSSNVDIRRASLPARVNFLL